MNIKQRLILMSLLPALMTGCQGSLFNNLIVMETHDPSDPALVNEDRYGKRERPALWGECERWQQFHFTSLHDVDTAWNKLIRHQVVDIGRIPVTNKNPELDAQLTQAWSSPVERPGLLYVMPPRWAAVRVNDFNQLGVVAFRISPNNTGARRGSLIDVEYCIGGSYELGYYLPPQTVREFEPALKKNFEAALRKV